MAVGAGVGLTRCGVDPGPAALVAYAERSLEYAPLLLAAKRGLWSEPPAKLGMMQLPDGRAVVEAVATGRALAGAVPLPDLVAAAGEGGALVGIAALTARLDCELVVTTARTVPIPTLAAMHLGEWRGLRVGVQSGSGGTEAFVRLVALWSDASRTAPQPAFAPRAPQRQLAGSAALDGEVRWSAFDTDAGLAAALADRRLEGFLGRSYAGALAVSHGSGTVAQRLAEGGENHVLSALPTVLVTRREGLDVRAEALLRQMVAAVARAAGELAGPEGAQAAGVALPEKDQLRLALALRLMSPNAAATAFATDARLTEEPVRRYAELSAMAGMARMGPSAGALTTSRFIG